MDTGNARPAQRARRYATHLTLAALCAVASLWGARHASADPTAVSFPEADYRKHIEVLSSDAFEGRAPGTEGEKKTVEYIEQQFREAGLSPGIGGQYRQAVPLVRIQPQADSAMRIASAAGKSLDLAVPDEVVAWTRRPVPVSGIDGAGVVFAGYGIVAPEYGWDDYAGLDVRGKLVLVLVNDPGYATGDPKLFNGRTMTYYGRWTYKFEEAVRHGAAGLLVIHETGAAAYPWDVPRNGATKPQFDLVVPDYESKRLALEGWIKEDAAARTLAAAGLDYAALKQAAARRGFKPVATDLKATMSVRNEVKHIDSYNVVGTLPGSKRPGETFVYMAHWDHLGRNANAKPGEDAIFNGAQDNATGIAALIELARAFAATKPRPERSLTFVAVTAEESGLLGSEYFALHPPVPPRDFVGGLNMDNLYSVGPTRDLTVIGYGKSELEDDLAAAAAKQQRTLVQEPMPEKGFYYRSDHFNMAKVGVPMLYAKAGVDSPEHGADFGRQWIEEYTADHYHQPSDEYSPDWDVRGNLMDLAIYYDVGLMLANSDRWPNWRQGTEFRAIRDQGRP